MNVSCTTCLHGCHTDPPGAPINPVISEESDTSVTIDFQLPQEGTPPFINIILNFSEPQLMLRNYTGTYMPGQQFQAKVSDLNPKTAYTLKARAVNYAGNGPDSEPITFTTSEHTTSECTMWLWQLLHTMSNEQSHYCSYLCPHS